MYTDCCCYRYIKTFGETGHGYAQEFIGLLKSLLRESIEFRAKQEGKLSIADVELLKVAAFLVGAGGNNTIAVDFKSRNGGWRVIDVAVIIAVNIKPFV